MPRSTQRTFRQKIWSFVTHAHTHTQTFELLARAELERSRERVVILKALYTSKDLRHDIDHDTLLHLAAVNLKRENHRVG